MTTSKDLKYQYPGSLVQINTKHICILSRTFYLFSAIDTYTRLGYVHAYSTITSSSAEKLLDEVTRQFPFSINAIQT
ncbi:hypothetical protein V6O07_06605, partial [Arthrospira platensis SPKY2]